MSLREWLERGDDDDVQREDDERVDDDVFAELDEIYLERRAALGRPMSHDELWERRRRGLP